MGSILAQWRDGARFEHWEPMTPSHGRRLGKVAALFPAVGLAFALSSPYALDAPQRGGIWKAVVPPKPMAAEFEGFDPVGVAAGARIKADCSLNWINPDDGARYCFSSGTSLQYFLDRPHAMIERARASWRQSNGK